MAFFVSLICVYISQYSCRHDISYPVYGNLLRTFCPTHHKIVVKQLEACYVKKNIYNS